MSRVVTCLTADGANTARVALARSSLYADVVIEKSVLIVDDDPMIRSALAPLLASSRVEVSTAATAEEALRLLRRRRFDLVITDLRLEDDHEGLAIVSAARDAVPDAKVVVFSALDGAGVRDEALRRGATAYWPKSMPAPTVLDGVRALGIPVDAD